MTIAYQRIWIPALLFLSLSCGVFQPVPTNSQSPAGSSGANFQFPYIPKNSRRPVSLILGDKYVPQPDGRYLIEGFRIQTFQYHSNRMTTNFLVSAPSCLLDIRKRIASSPGAVTASATDGSVSIAGTRGFEWRQTESRLTISNEVSTTLDRDLIALSGTKNDQ
jgi:hypothetical protein